MENNIFKSRLKSLGIDRQVDAAMIVAKAQEEIKKALGQRGLDNLQVVSFSKGTLKIAASTPGQVTSGLNKIGAMLTEPFASKEN